MAAQISAVTLVVPDYDAAIQFYVGTLGFDLIEDVPLGGDKRWVLVAPPGAAGGTRLLLARAANERQRKAIGEQTGGRVGFFLATDDFDTDFAAMRSAGVTLKEDPRHESYGRVVVWRDPFGNRWDLLERPAKPWTG